MKILIDLHKDLEGDIVSKSSMEKGFTKFRKILKDHNLEKFFRFELGKGGKTLKYPSLKSIGVVYGSIYGS